jgi:hypothetical protein
MEVVFEKWIREGRARKYARFSALATLQLHWADHFHQAPHLQQLCPQSIPRAALLPISSTNPARNLILKHAS